MFAFIKLEIISDFSDRIPLVQVALVMLNSEYSQRFWQQHLPGVKVFSSVQENYFFLLEPFSRIIKLIIKVLKK